MIHLREHLELQIRIDIGQEYVWARPKVLRDRGMKVGKEVQPGFQSLRIAHLAAIAPAPGKGFAREHLEACQIDIAGLQKGQML